MKATIIAVLSLLSAAEPVLGSPAPTSPTVLKPHMIGYGQNLDRRAGGCAADNCARAVTGTYQGTNPTLSSHIADCSSFFYYTFIPPTSTSTVTVTPSAQTQTVVASTETDTTVVSTETDTVYTTTTNVEVYNKRSLNTGTIISPSAVPTYASACSGTSRYSSACSCAGVTKRTLTLPSPVTTTTQTAPSPTTTLSITTTTTTSATATVTVGTYVDDIPCGQTLDAPDSGVPYKVLCGAVGADPQTLLSQNVVGDWDVCVKNADDNFASNSFTFQLSTSICSIYTNQGSNMDSTPNSDFVYGYFRP